MLSVIFSASPKRQVFLACAFMLLVLPWLEPVAPGPSAAAVPLMFSWLCMTIVLGLGVWREPHLVAWGWLAAAVVSAVFGLMQYFGIEHLGLGLINGAEPGTAFGNLRQRNQFASLMAIGMAAVLFLAVHARRLRSGAAGMVLLAIATAASASRTGAVQIAMLLMLSVIWAGPARAARLKLSAIALAAYIPAMLLLPHLLFALTGHEAHGLLDRVAGSAACSSRMVLWSNVIDLIRERPWTGWGAGELDYAHFAHLYAGPRFCDILDNAHNLPLHIGVEFGLPVAVLLFGFAAAFILRAKPWHEHDPAARLAWTVLAIVAVHSLLEYPLWYGPFQLATVLSVLMLVPAAQATSRSAWRNAGRATAFVVVPLALAYAAWDYHRISQLYMQPEERSPRYRDGTLAKASESVLFSRQVKFAQLTVTPLTRANAAAMNALALDMLHFSPEPKVIELVIDSAMVLRDEDTARWHMLRYRAAFPNEYIEWLGRSGYKPPARPSGANKAP